MSGGKHGDDDGDGLINRLDPDADAYEQGVLDAQRAVVEARLAARVFIDELGEVHRPESDFTGEWAHEHAAQLASLPRGAARPVGLTAETLRAGMGGPLSLDRYRQMLPGFSAAMVTAGIVNTRRAAMWFAQIGHESLGLRYMHELWGPTEQQKKYDKQGTELARQLGNGPGDGPLYMGRGALMVTGKRHYSVLSRWAFDQRLVPTPTFFVDRPDELGSDRYGFVGAVWYWLTQRPLNTLSDAGDIRGATKAVNGGLTHLDDRERRYKACLALGAALLPAQAGPSAPAGPDPAIARRHRQQALILGDPVERPFGPGDSTHRIVCPTGKASKIVASSWLSASVAGRARVQVWAQVEKQGAAFPDGAAPKDQAERDWSLFGGDRPHFELPSGTEMVTVQVSGATGFGSISIEQLAA